MYEDVTDESRFKVGMDGGHLLTTFQCDLCVFRTLFKRDPMRTRGDEEALVTIRRMNLDAIWAREPSTTANNMRQINNIIATCEAAGFDAKLPPLGPLPFEDVLGFTVAFTMLTHSLRTGRNSKEYTQYATIRKNRAAFSNLYGASVRGANEGAVISMGAESKSKLTECPSNSVWFTKWANGCETRMGFIERKNRAISIDLFMELLRSFKREIKKTEKQSWERFCLVSGMAYSTLTFVGSFRGSETLKLDWRGLVRDIEKGNIVRNATHLKRGRQTRSVADIPHIVIPLRGRFKGEQGERCHLVPMANETATGIPIRAIVEAFMAARKERSRNACNWGFIDEAGNKLSFRAMNDIVMDRLEVIKDEDLKNEFNLEGLEVREEYSINRSFRRGCTTHGRNQQIPKDVVEAHNRWRKQENSKGKKPKMEMIEEYSDIELLIPTRVRFTEML